MTLRRPPYSFWKRALDIAASLAGLALFSPFLAVICLLIAADSRGPVFFLQTRVGRNAKPFKIFKFRTMVPRAESAGPAVTKGGDPRITRIGGLLRRTKIDELPQLINVLAGEMSLVGPRPEVGKYVALFEDDYRDILTIRPGITDYASVAFRNENELLRGAADPEDEYVQNILPIKIKYYKRYLKQQGFWTDIRILLMTMGLNGQIRS
jgi:lipopolysaccharide/colanic/teichoic acid biosynthesis glycosyltransferase